MIVTKVPGLDTQAAFDSTGAVPITDIGAVLRRRPAVVVINADTRAAPPDLVGARREPGRPGERQPDHPPGRQLRRGRPLHRRAAQPEGRERARSIQAQRPVPRLPRPHRKRATRPSRRAGRTWSRSSRRWAGRHRAQRPLPRLGLHGRQRAQPHRARALHPRRRVRAARRHEPRRPAGRRAPRRTFTVTHVTDYTAAQDAEIARKVDGHRHGAVLPERRRLPARVAVRLRCPARPCRSASRATRWLANFIVPDPARRGGRAGRSLPSRPSLYGHGLLGSAQRDHRREHQGDGQRAQLRLLRHRLVRHVDAGRAEHRRRSSATSRTSRRCRTARSRAS